MTDAIRVKRAFSGASAADTMTAILEQDPPDPPVAEREDSSGARTHRRSVPGEASGGAIPAGSRSGVALAPDGRQVIFLANGEKGSQLWLRPLD